MTDLVFLDTETTGLDSDIHDIWEIAWALNEGPVFSAIVPYSLQTADPAALEMNGYWDRGVRAIPDERLDVTLRDLLKGNTIVGANIGFDLRFLKARWSDEPWHYRTIDIESMALAILEYDRPKGLHAIRNDLEALGYVLAIEPDHSAKNDVVATRDVYNILRFIQKEKNRALAGPVEGS